jgi:lysophospholipid acyltransferase (LPLAT)-like uncharacterized protein
MFKSKVLPFFVYGFYFLWTSTWRLRLYETPEMKELIASRKPIVMAFWHGDELAILAFKKFYRLTTMSSTSKDGELMNSILGHMGIKTSRGSSTRGGARALIGLIRWAKEGWTPAIPVDGPKGPIYKVKPGIFDLAKRLDAAIIPAGMWCSNRILFKKSWNQTYLPLPFSKVHLRWGPPMRLLDVELDSRDQVLAERLEAALNSAREVAAEIPNC